MEGGGGRRGVANSCLFMVLSGTVPRPLSVSTGPMTVMPLSPMATITKECLTSSGHWSLIPSAVKI